ncbi:hypothetical protein [Pseudomaricurvus sp. HS19]|uniref:hypothetical protein n=1 Tax=Pseudomaricurvus sp. HS19 TaxID=2692626 RepID=UPI001370D739|nr:hypothetical protein [Pseudomaricurvus sp. HS19]MYM63025.1 hypothetical protein [Pseudomaricurvus sp. HS19]
MSAPTWLSTDDAQFLTRGLSISLASRDLRHVPSLTRAFACRYSDDGRQLILILSRSQSSDLLRDVAACGELAVVVTEPSTHRTLQVKGSDAIITDLVADDLAVVDQSRAHFGTDILPLGFDSDFNQRLFAFDPGDLCRILMTPTDVFQQTPGPGAGERIGPQS